MVSRSFNNTIKNKYENMNFTKIAEDLEFENDELINDK